MPSTPTDAALRAALAKLRDECREFANDAGIPAELTSYWQLANKIDRLLASDAALRARETETPAEPATAPTDEMAQHPELVRAIQDWEPLVRGSAIGIGNALNLDASGVEHVRQALLHARVNGWVRAMSVEPQPPAPTPPPSHAATLREIADWFDWKYGPAARFGDSGARSSQLRAAADAMERLEQAQRDTTELLEDAGALGGMTHREGIIWLRKRAEHAEAVIHAARQINDGVKKVDQSSQYDQAVSTLNTIAAQLAPAPPSAPETE